MKYANILLIRSLLITSCNTDSQTMVNKIFISKKETKTATIILDDSIEAVFPLFGAFEERKWAKGWNPKLIYPSVETIEEGTTFTTEARGNNEKEFLWRVSKYEAKNFLIQYLVSTQNRYWTITVKCNPTKVKKTSVSITYSFIGLNEIGNKLNKQSLEKMYEYNLTDWQNEINTYLLNRKL